MHKATTTVMSAYEQEMRDAIHKLADEGVLAFRLETVVDRMGRKVTHAARKHIADLCADGTIRKYEYFTDRGGRAVAYYLPEPKALALPF